MHQSMLMASSYSRASAYGWGVNSEIHIKGFGMLSLLPCAADGDMNMNWLTLQNLESSLPNKLTYISGESTAELSLSQYNVLYMSETTLVMGGLKHHCRNYFTNADANLHMPQNVKVGICRLSSFTLSYYITFERVQNWWSSRRGYESLLQHSKDCSTVWYNIACE